jgi:hypothetical protein
MLISVVKEDHLRVNERNGSAAEKAWLLNCLLSWFENNGSVVFLFGDTVGALDRALDTMATTEARDPEAGVRLDFLTSF